ncbi:MAG TPA: ATP-dependent protease, partial [Halieaceae bacterium]|nr:ATP-dependent protease [Halieaceae bacterium]
IEGRERFHLSDTRVASNGLVLGNVVFESMPEQAEFDDAWLSLREILENLKQHPHVRRMGLEIDFDDAWQVGYTLAQLLPLEESLKYSLLNAGDVEELMDQLDLILSDISGEG